jgi:hypothetical protein
MTNTIWKHGPHEEWSGSCVPGPPAQGEQGPQGCSGWPVLTPAEMLQQQMSFKSLSHASSSSWSLPTTTVVAWGVCGGVFHSSPRAFPWLFRISSVCQILLWM